MSIYRTLENQIGPGQVVFFGFSWGSFGTFHLRINLPTAKPKKENGGYDCVCQVYHGHFNIFSIGKPRVSGSPDLAASRGAAGAPLALNSPLPTDPTCHLGAVGKHWKTTHRQRFLG